MKSLRILLVEDDVSLAKSTAKLIERMSVHRVQITVDPKTIFELCTNHLIDIVIMDINLPGASWEGEEISGTDLSRLIKENPETSQIPVLMLTAYAMENEREVLMIDSQANDLLTKPIRDYRIFIQTLEQLAQI